MGEGQMVEGRFALISGALGVRDFMAAAREAEGLGYEAALLGESGIDTDAFVASAAALLATERIRVGSGIANIADRHPVALARAAAALDGVAPGRALLGIGKGDPATVRDTLGAGPPLPGAEAVEDALRIIRPLLRGERVAYRGSHWSAHIGPPPPRVRTQQPVPILLGAVGPRTLRLAGALADGVLLNEGCSPAYVAWAIEQIAGGADAAGRDPGAIDIYALVLVARTDRPDGAAQVEWTRRRLQRHFALPGEGRNLMAPAGDPPSRWDAADLARFAAVGDHDTCEAYIAGLRAAGAGCVVLLPAGLRALHG